MKDKTMSETSSSGQEAPSADSDKISEHLIQKLVDLSNSQYVPFTTAIEKVAGIIFGSEWSEHPARDFYPFVLRPRGEPKEIVEYVVDMKTAKRSSETADLQEIVSELGSERDAIAALQRFEEMFETAARAIIGALEREPGFKGFARSTFHGLEPLSNRHIGAMRAQFATTITSGRLRLEGADRDRRRVAYRVFIERQSLDHLLSIRTHDGETKGLALDEKKFLRRELESLNNRRLKATAQSNKSWAFTSEQLEDVCFQALELHRKSNSAVAYELREAEQSRKRREILSFLRQIKEEIRSAEGDGEDDYARHPLADLFQTTKDARGHKQKALALPVIEEFENDLRQRFPSASNDVGPSKK